MGLVAAGRGSGRARGPRIHTEVLHAGLLVLNDGFEMQDVTKLVNPYTY